MDIEETNPIDALRKVLELGTKGHSLHINTRLPLDDEFLVDYKQVFGWHFKDSLRSLLSSDISNPIYEFSYFDRIHKYFGIDQMDFVIEGLKRNSRSRVICTWDPKADLATKELIPCLTLIQFFKNGTDLDMSVVFRSRDIIRRMVPNWNALYFLHRQAADTLHMQMGYLSDYSLSWFYRLEDYGKLWAIL